MDHGVSTPPGFWGIRKNVLQNCPHERQKSVYLPAPSPIGQGFSWSIDAPSLPGYTYRYPKQEKPGQKVRDMYESKVRLWQITPVEKAGCYSAV